MKKLIIVCIMVLSLFGCGFDALKGQLAALGSRFKVTQYSCGKVIGQWESTGKVATEGQSDGYYFIDIKTGKLIRISGTVQMEQID